MSCLIKKTCTRYDKLYKKGDLNFALDYKQSTTNDPFLSPTTVKVYFRYHGIPSISLSQLNKRNQCTADRK